MKFKDILKAIQTYNESLEDMEMLQEFLLENIGLILVLLRKEALQCLNGMSNGFVVNLIFLNANVKVLFIWVTKKILLLDQALILLKK